jgi:hypothetical protein
MVILGLSSDGTFQQTVQSLVAGTEGTEKQSSGSNRVTDKKSSSILIY